MITDRYPGFLRHQLVELGYLKSAHSVSSDSVAFNVQPRRTGQILIGSSRQYGAEHKEVDHDILTTHAATRPGIHARARTDVGGAHVDWIPRGHARQVAADRSVAGRQVAVPGNRA